MRLKRIHLIYAIFFIASLVIFRVLDGKQSQAHSDGTLIALITVFSGFIAYYDFKRRLSVSRIMGPVVAFILINAGVVAFIFVSGLLVSVAFLIPFFMIEGAIIYWLLERRAAALNNDGSPS